MVPMGNRHMVVEFGSYDAAVARRQSPEYQEVSKHGLEGDRP